MKQKPKENNKVAHWNLCPSGQRGCQGCSYKHATDNLKDIIKKCIEKMSEIIEE